MKNFNKLFFTLSLLFAQAHCMLKNTKDTYQILSNDYKHLSIAHGAIAWETGFIRRLYDFGQIYYTTTQDKNNPNLQVIEEYIHPEKTHKTVRLIHILFYRVPGSTGISDFGVTQKLKVLDTKGIAQIMAEVLALIENIKSRDYLYSEQINTLKAALSSHTESKKFGNPLASITNIFKAPWDEKAFSSVKKTLKSYDEFSQLLKTLEETKKLLVTDLNGCEKKVKTLLEPIALKKADLRDLILGSLRECNQNSPDCVFMPHTTEMVIEAFVYKACSQDRSALATFYTILDDKIQGACLKRIPDQSWIEDTFQSINQQEASAKIMKINDDRENNFEEFFFALAQINSFPTPVGYETAKYTFPDNNSVTFPNCFDNAIRNFINTLSYDADKNILSIETLRKRLGKPADHSFNSKLEHYIIDFKNPSLAASPKAHNEWVGVISNIPFVAYKHMTANKDQLPVNRGFMKMPIQSSNLVQKIMGLGMYEQLPSNAYGYEVRALLYNFVICLNYLLNLKLFANDEALAQQIADKNFLSNTLPLLKVGLNADDLYVSKSPNVLEGDYGLDIDQADFADPLFTTILIGDLRCELRTRKGHGELELFGSPNQYEKEIAEQPESFFISDNSLGLALTEFKSRRNISLDLIANRSAHMVYSHLFTTPLENTDIIGFFIKDLAEQEHPIMNLPPSAIALFKRLANKQPDEDIKLRLIYYCGTIATIYGYFDMAVKTAHDLFSNVNNLTSRGWGIEIYGQVFTKGQALKILLPFIKQCVDEELTFAFGNIYGWLNIIVKKPEIITIFPMIKNAYFSDEESSQITATHIVDAMLRTGEHYEFVLNVIAEGFKSSNNEIIQNTISSTLDLLRLAVEFRMMEPIEKLKAIIENSINQENMSERKWIMNDMLQHRIPDGIASIQKQKVQIPD